MRWTVIHANASSEPLEGTFLRYYKGHLVFLTEDGPVDLDLQDVRQVQPWEER